MAQCPRCARTVGESDRYCPSCGEQLLPSSQMSTLVSPSPGSHEEPLARSPTPSAAQQGHHIPGALLGGRYRIIERVGRGGMGEVYRAEDLRVGQVVALKFIRHTSEPGDVAMDMFLSEVRLARQIGHPNVCRVYDIGEADGVSFLSMEFVDGEDLASLLRRIRRLPPDKATEIARELCAGLAAIHDRDVLHRDLKPANVMVDGRGRTRITDFGLAALQHRTGEGDVVGTPAYMAPEVRAGRAASMKSDLYSLGLVLFEIYTGDPPSEAASATRARTPARQRSDGSSPSRALEPAVAGVIRRCLAEDPADRPASALEVAAVLPGGDPIAAALSAGRTLEPELLAAAGARERAMDPRLAWACAAALALGLATMITVAPRTRVVPPLPMNMPPAALAANARAILQKSGFAEPADVADGMRYDRSIVERVAATDRSSDRWRRLAQGDEPLVLYWRRESPRPMVPLGPTLKVSLDEPPATVPGMVSVQLDLKGQLRRLDAVPAAASAAGTPNWQPLFEAAGLELGAFAASEPRMVPSGYASERLAWEGPAGVDVASRVRVEAASLGSRPVLFAVTPIDATPPAPPGASAREVVDSVGSGIRAVLLLAAFLLAAWLARRNLRAGRGDRIGATRLGAALMASRLLVWILGGHHTLAGFPAQFPVALAWSLYDFAFARIFYLAVEPYARHFWPRMLVSWVRVLGGRFRDPLVGRDILLGCLAGMGLGLFVAAHQAAPVLFGLPPGRPDNVGFVEPTLNSLMGLRSQLAQLLVLDRSGVVNALGFVVVLVALLLVLRRLWIAIPLAALVFLSMAMPRGELLALNLVLAAGSVVVLLVLLMRVGLLAVMVALMVNSTLQGTVLSWRLTAWPGDTAWLALAFVLGLGVAGAVRAAGGRPSLPRLLE